MLLLPHKSAGVDFARSEPRLHDKERVKQCCLSQLLKVVALLRSALTTRTNQLQTRKFDHFTHGFGTRCGIVHVSQRLRSQRLRVRICISCGIRDDCKAATVVNPSQHCSYALPDHYQLSADVRLRLRLIPSFLAERTRKRTASKKVILNVMPAFSCTDSVAPAPSDQYYTLTGRSVRRYTVDQQHQRNITSSNHRSSSSADPVTFSLQLRQWRCKQHQNVCRGQASSKSLFWGCECACSFSGRSKRLSF